jgi:hypothetical protein
MRQQVVWTPLMDSLLMDAISRGCTFARAGRQAGVNKDQAASRFKRLKDRMGWQAQ